MQTKKENVNQTRFEFHFIELQHKHNKIWSHSFERYCMSLHFDDWKYKTTMLKPCANDHIIMLHVKSQIVLIRKKNHFNQNCQATLPPFFQTDLIRDIEECMRAPRPVAFRLVKMFEVGTWMKECRERLHGDV